MTPDVVLALPLRSNHKMSVMTSHPRGCEPCGVLKSKRRKASPMSPNPYSPDSVLVVSFGDDPKNDTNAYQALTDLRQLD